MGQSELDKMTSLLKDHGYLAPKMYARRLLDEGCDYIRVMVALLTDSSVLRRSHGMLQVVQ